MVTACAARGSAADRQLLRPLSERLLAFDNSTIEPVTIFLEERGSRWFVGYVLPGRQADLRLPTASNNPSGREFTLVVVPSSARRTAAGRSTAPFPGPVTADRVPGDYLTNVRWKLTGKWLVSVPLQRAP